MLRNKFPGAAQVSLPLVVATHFPQGLSYKKMQSGRHRQIGLERKSTLHARNGFFIPLKPEKHIAHCDTGKRVIGIYPGRDEISFKRFLVTPAFPETLSEV